jgi:two-component system NtrC family sensor kinase
MANGNGSKSKRQPVNEVESTPLAKAGTAVLEAERERVEEVWGEPEHYRTAILDSLNELVVFQDLEHRVLWANKIAGESVGLPAEELVGRYCHDVWGRGGQPCPGCPVAKARKKGKPQASEMTTPDGKVWLVKGYPILNASGDVSGLVEMTLEITERKKAEEKLQAEKNKLQSVISAMEDGLNIMDKDYNIIYQSRLPRKLYGDHLGEKCYRVYAGSEEICDGCPVKKAFKDGKSHTSEKALISPSGELTYWETTANPVRDAEGNIVSCLEIARNITERKRVEEELQGEKNKLQSVINAMEDGVTIQDKDFNILFQNEPLAKNYGGHIGEKCYRVYEGRDTICDGCPVKKAFKDGRSHTAQRKVVLPSGEEAFGENTASPIGDAEGNIVSCVEIVRDITGRKRVEEQLQTERNKLQSVIDSLEYGLTIQDRDFNIIYQNEQAKKPFGEHIGEKCYRAYAGRKKVCEDCPVKKAFKDGKSHTVVKKNTTRPGMASYWENTASPIRDASGKIVSCLEITRNITKRKQAEEELQAEKNKLQSVVDAIEYGITIQDRDYNIIYQNELLEELFGDRLGEKCYRVYEGREELCDGCPVKKAFKDGKSYTSEREVVMPSGEVNFWENTANPIRDANGNIVSCLEITRNITERKKAEQVLADEATRRRILVDESSDGIVVLDEKGKVYEANKRFAEMLGYTYKEAQKLSVWDWEFLFPREQVAEMIASIGPEGDHFETKHRRKDGSTFDVEISTNGAVVSGQKLIFCVCRDITERKQAEAALAEAEKKYKNLVEATSDLIWEADTQGIYTFVSPNIKDLLGYEVEEVVGKKRTLDFSPKKEVRKWLKHFKTINAKRESFAGLEVLHHHKDGTPLIFEVSGVPFFDSAGNFQGYVGINKNVTERKQMTEALKESQKFSTGLMENSPNPKSVLNPDTSIRYVNPAFEKLTGYKLAEVVGRKAPYPWWPKAESKTMIKALKNAIQSGGKKSEHVFHKRNGEPFWVMLNSAPVIHRKKLLYFLINWLDITDRKRAEEEKTELEQKAHLASRLASVGEMASGIAHEINNPLTAVIGFAQLLMDTDLPDEIKEDLVIIHKEAQRAAGVARNLLTFARKHAPSQQSTNVNSIIEGVLTLRAYEQNVSNIQIITKLTPDLPEVMADYSQLQQVFINIILNAEAAMLEANNGGTLTITTQQFNHSVRASFADNGPGINKENLNRIFDPFFTTKEVGKGTGLGLSVCHGIIAEHGGKIYARSKPGSGATFIVELPISSQEPAGELNEPAK